MIVRKAFLTMLLSCKCEPFLKPFFHLHSFLHSLFSLVIASVLLTNRRQGCLSFLQFCIAGSFTASDTESTESDVNLRVLLYVSLRKKV